MASGIKFQNVDFRSVDEFLDFLSKDELEIALRLRNLILQCIPGVTEKLAYNVPFYKKYKNICFVWPASVLWGKKKTYAGVRLGFANGYLLNDETNYLEKGGRKQVYWKDFEKPDEIDDALIKSFIFEAAELDERMNKTALNKKKKQKVKSKRRK